MNKHILLGCAGINSALLLNYILWYVGASTIAPWLCVPFVLAGFLFLSFSVIRYQLFLWPIPAFLLALLLISLSSPTVAWDARSIWLFHAKRIFLDGNLFAQLDGYAPWSHNDYPVILPALSASIASLVGVWNEILPKTANIAFLIVPMFLIGSVMQGAVSIILFLTASVYICSHYLHNGFVDANVAFMITSLVLAVFKFKDLEQRYQNLLIFIVATSLSILCLMKNEGVLLFGIYFSLLFIYGYFFKILNFLNLLTISLCPLFFAASWKLYCFTHNIKNDLTSSDLLSQVTTRILSFGDVAVISRYLFYDIWTVAFLVIVLIVILNKQLVHRKDAVFSGFFAIVYMLCLFVVYLSTPHDLIWHLNTSAIRIIMPVNILSVAVLIYVLNIVLLGKFKNFCLCSKGKNSLSKT